MNIRMLDTEDAGQYQLLRLEGLKTDPSAFGSTYEREVGFSLEDFEQRIAPSENQLTVGGFDEMRLVCTASFTRSQEPKSKHKGSLVAMYCKSSYRGTGIAKEVVRHLLDRVRELKGIEMINLAVVTENTRATAFYESFGFEIYGTEPKAMFDGKKYYDENKMALDMKDNSFVTNENIREE
ncbi:GNAT family N-acetyltransferase [Salinicoccus cyprini]|uniref:GNAT family N-acetyltransferase n=1 Tax=Salinicoccus cyprini TaxID=2493691 RepID=A0A558AU83_9STAP|nr:GNAT family N-acetyltransferase [Salinicoccus cyprini]TVT27736.1 GNAT family N-acetyltransferase [Salinicoccus cyprini]